MNRGAWQAIVHGVAKSWTRLSDRLSLSGGYKRGDHSYFLILRDRGNHGPEAVAWALAGKE